MNPAFTFERISLMSGFDGKECKVYPRLIQAGGNMFLSYTMLLLSGMDVFHDAYFVKSTDGGKSFGEPERLQRLETVQDGIRAFFLSTTQSGSPRFILRDPQSK